MGKPDISAEPYGTADNSAKNISLVGIRGNYSLDISYHKSCCSDVVEHDAESAHYLLAFSVLARSQRLYLGNGVFKYIRFVDARLAVKYAESAFKSHSRIHVALCKRLVLALGVLVVLHKHVVPDFEESALGRIVEVVLSQLVRCGVISYNVHLGIGTAGTRCTCRTPPVPRFGKIIDVFGQNSAVEP